MSFCIKQIINKSMIQSISATLDGKDFRRKQVAMWFKSNRNSKKQKFDINRYIKRIGLFCLFKKK